MENTDSLAYFILAASGTLISIVLLICIFEIVVFWKIFAKAGIPGWASIIPFYNIYCLYKITLGNGWLFLLNLIPIVNVIIGIIVLLKLAKVFGKGVGFGIGLIFLNIIFTAIIAFDNSTYIGANGKPSI